MEAQLNKTIDIMTINKKNQIIEKIIITSLSSLVVISISSMVFLWRSYPQQINKINELDQKIKNIEHENIKRDEFLSMCKMMESRFDKIEEMQKIIINKMIYEKDNYHNNRNNN